MASLFPCVDTFIDVRTSIYDVNMPKKPVAPTPADPKTALVQIRVTPAEKIDWQIAAQADLRSMSDWVRLIVSSFMSSKGGSR